MEIPYDKSDATNSNALQILTLDKVLDQAVLQLDVDAAALFIKSSSGSLDYLHGKGFRISGSEDIFINSIVDIAGQAMNEGRIFSISDLRLKGRNYSRPQMLVAEEFVSYHVAPLFADGNPRGIIEVYSRKIHDPKPAWLDLFDTIARDVSLALQNQNIFQTNQLNGEKKQVSYGATLDAWMAAMLLRGGEIEGHARRVTDMTLRLAKAVGIPEEQLGNVVRGAMLHDVGKLVIPDQILQKPGPLTKKEWELMHKHPEFAYQMLSPISELRPALSIPYSHHERWDGSGYPQGLSETDIPLQVRVFSIVDVWDALRSDRPYRDAWPDSAVYRYISDQSGKYFDPRVTRAFLDLI